MKKILFVYDAKIIVDDNKNRYTNGTITEKNWKDRYCKYGKVTMISFLDCRKKTCIAEGKYSRIPDNVKFVPLEQNTASIKDYISLAKRRKNKELIKEHVMMNDVVIARVPSNNAYIAIKYALRYKKEVIVEVVGSSFDSLWNHSLKGKILSLNSFLKQKNYIRKAPNVIYVTKEYLQKKYPTKGKNIACSDAEISVLRDDALEQRLKKIELLDDDSKIILGTCGAIDIKYKGHLYVIKALSELKKKGLVKYEYQIVGDGSSNGIIKAARKYDVIDQIRIMGPMNHDAIFDWLKNIDIYIQPSNTEGLCRSVIEAMSMGVPCLVSRVGGNPELIDSKYSFDKKNYMKLADLICNYRKGEMVEQSKKNYNKAKEFDKKRLGSKRKSFYETVMG